MAVSAASVHISSTEGSSERTERNRCSSQLLDHNSSLVSNTRRKRYGTVGFDWRVNSYVLHQVAPSDTLQGIALKYHVPVSEIKRENSIFTGEEIHCFSTLRIPLPSGSQSPTPQGSPILSRQAMAGSLEQHPGLVTNLETRTVSAGLEHTPIKMEAFTSQQGSFQEEGIRSIASVLSAADLQIKASQEFSEKLQAKNATLKHLPDTYTSKSIPQFKEPAPPKERSFSLKIPSLPFRTTWSPTRNRDQVEDEIFEL